MKNLLDCGSLQNNDAAQGIEMRQKGSLQIGGEECFEMESDATYDFFSEHGQVSTRGGNVARAPTTLNSFFIEAPWMLANIIDTAIEALFMTLFLSLILQLFFPVLNGNTCQCESAEVSYRCFIAFCRAEIVCIQTQEIAQTIVLTVLLHSLRKANACLNEAKHLLTKHIDLDVRHLRDAHKHLQKVVINGLLYLLYLNAVGWHKLLKRSAVRGFVDHVDCAVSVLRTFFFWVSLIWAGILVRMRVDALTNSSFAVELESRASSLKKLEPWQWVCAGLALALCGVLMVPLDPSTARRAMHALQPIRVIFWLLQSNASITAVRAFLFTYRAVAQAKRELNGTSTSVLMLSDAERAVKMQRGQLFGVIAMAASASLMAFSTICRFAAELIYGEVRKREPLKFCISGVPIFVNSLTLGLNSVILSGALQIDFSIFKDQIDRAYEREARRTSAVQAKPKPTRSVSFSTEKEYKDTVTDLAQRSVSVQSILKFYKKLGPRGIFRKDFNFYFDAQKHTTTDVVWQAIIPYSRKMMEKEDELPVACSRLMEKEGRLPDRMVTHTWSSLFSHLVASVVADALEEQELDMICYLLQHDIAELVRWVKWSGNSERRYWICAFSVNQHVSICHQPQNKGYTPCECKSPKYSNDHVLCEMNKFRDMMQYIHFHSQDNLEQIIAVDQEFKLFSRAWCIAEIHLASETGIKQHLKLPSRRSLKEFEPQLRTYRVDDLESTWPLDKALILASIDNKNEFENDVRSLLFDRDAGLFRRWESADSVQKMMNSGRIVRFVQAKHDKTMWPRRTERLSKIIVEKQFCLIV